MMGYYQRQMGDYSTGGYGQMGDPGLLSFIGKAAKSIWKVAKPIIFGPAVTTAAAVAAGTAVTHPSRPPGWGGVPPPAPLPGGIPAAAGQFAGTALGAYAAARPVAMGGLCPSGYHPAKDGSGRCVRNRRMNVANPRALRRSLRRVKGFEKLARKTIVMTRRVRSK